MWHTPTELFSVSLQTYHLIARCRSSPYRLSGPCQEFGLLEISSVLMLFV